MKKHLLAGIILLLPITLTLLIISYLFDLLTSPFLGIVERLLLAYHSFFPIDFAHHGTLIVFFSRVIALGLLLLTIVSLGFLGRKLFFKFLFSYTNALFLRIPLVKTMYRLLHDITKAVFSQTGKTFKKTVLVPFPHPEIHSVGFITGDVPPAFKKALKELEICVFVPTAPHPISGFILMTAHNQVKEVEVEVEDTFKFLLSCGLIHPETKHET